MEGIRMIKQSTRDPQSCEDKVERTETQQKKKNKVVYWNS